MIKAGINHKGFAFIDVLQPCVSFNHVNTFAWYKQRVYKLEGTDYRPDNKLAAFEKVQEWGERIPIGTLYQAKRPIFEDQFPSLTNEPLVKRPLEPKTVEKLLATFM